MSPRDFIDSVSLFLPGGGTAAGSDVRIYTVVGPTGATGPDIFIDPDLPTGNAPLWFNTSDGNLYILFDGVYVGL